MKDSLIFADNILSFDLGAETKDEFLQTVIEALDVPFYVWSVDGALIMANKACAEETGIKRQEALGRPGKDIYPPKMNERWLEVNQQVIDKGTSVQEEEFVDNPEGRQVYVSLKFPIKDESGRIVAVGGVSFKKKD